MNQLTVDPATGFLTSDNRWSFKAEDKIQFIALAQECVDRKEAPNLKAICNRVGVTMRTFWNHIDQDAEFRGQWDEIRFQVEDILSQSLVNLGQKANGVGACAFWLKNRVPERWSDNPGVNQTNYDFAWIKKLGEAINSVSKPTIIATEAEIISTPKPISNE